MASAARVEGLEKSALALCTFALIAIFLTGFVGYFAVNRIWPNFYYSVVKDGEDVWLLMQLGLHGLVRSRGFSRIQRHPPHESRDGVTSARASIREASEKCG